MKKIYALAAAAVAALSMNAQNGAPLYITGQSAAADLGGFPVDVWNVGDKGDPTQFTYEDGVYKIHVNGLSSFTISKAADGTWATWQSEGNCYTCDYGDAKGVAKDLTLGTDNILTPWLGDYDVVVAGDLSTITLTTDTPEPPLEVYLRGNMNEWLNNGATDTPEGKKWMFSTTDNKIFKLVLEDGMAIAGGESFKIADAGWAKFNFGGDGESFLYETPLDVYFNASANLFFAADEDPFTGVCYMQYMGKEGTQAFFSNDKDAECPFDNAVEGIEIDNSVNAAPVYYNLQGVRVNNPENGVFIVVKGDKTSKVAL